MLLLSPLSRPEPKETVVIPTKSLLPKENNADNKSLTKDIPLLNSSFEAKTSDLVITINTGGMLALFWIRL